MAASLLLVGTSFFVFDGVQTVAAGALRGMGAVAAGLIGATAIKLAKGLKTSVLGWRWCTAFGLASLVAIAALRVPLVYVIFGLGGLACALAYRKLQP